MSRNQSLSYLHIYIDKTLRDDLELIASSMGISLNQHLVNVLTDNAEHMKNLFLQSAIAESQSINHE